MKALQKALLTALGVSIAAMTGAPAAILVTEPFDYPVGLYSGPWSTTMGNASGTGWGGNAWFSHAGDGLTFGIATDGHTGTFADSTGMSNLTSEWRQRNMSPVNGNTDGAVTWQYLTVSVTGTGTAGWLATENSNGGMQFAVRVEADGTYGLSTGQRHLFFATSAITAATDPTNPDVIVVKMENQTDGATNQFDVSMWVNPISPTETGLPAPDLQILGTAPFAGNRDIGSINWRPGTTQIDNFMLTDDYADFGIVEPPGPPSEPANPDPADAASHVDISANLDWADTIRTTSYEVFLWKDGDAEPGTPTVTSTESVFDPPADLDYSTTYRWRVNALGPEGTTPGPLWTFTTDSDLPPDQVTNPSPADASDNITLDTSLGWGAAARAATYDVYLWKSSESKPGSPTASTASLSFTPAADLEAATIYQWQVDSVNGAGTTAGALWSFTTGLVPDVPSSPTPEDNATEQACFLVLGWADAAAATSYQIFVWPDGDSEPASPAATTTASLLKPTTILIPSTLYHWRVKAINSIGPASGPVWSFTTTSTLSAILVTEPFDYPAQTYAAGSWGASALLKGSGVGWGTNAYFDHTTAACNFVIGSGAATDTYFESTNQNYTGSYFRNRVMSLAIGNNTDGTVIWQSMLVWSDGTNTGGGMLVHNSNGGTNYKIQLATGNVYELLGGHDSPVSDLSAITASTDMNTPDLLVFKIENTTGDGNQTVSLWVNPTSPTDAGLPAPMLSVSYAPFTGNRNLGGINLRPSGIKMDEIVFATDYTAFGIGAGGSPYDTWAAAHAGGQVPDLDFDNDGVPNGVEFFMGSPDGFTANPGLEDSTVTWEHLNEVTSFEVQVSDNLIDWMAADPNDVDMSTDPTKVIFTLPTVEPKQFCRLVVTP